MFLLGLAFVVTALLYASVGFGGGSTYNALLALSGTDYRVLPAIALVCNIIVVSGGVIRFATAGLLRAKSLAPFMIGSVPAAWIGGRLPISETVFIGVLGCTLLLSGLHLLAQRTEAVGSNGEPTRRHKMVPIALGSGIGLLSGLVGIGGGIFLAPALYFLRWGTPRQIAAAASLFILVNSLSGLAGQLGKLGEAELVAALRSYWPLPLAVLIGGQAGSWLAGSWLSPPLIRRATAILILFVGIRLIGRWLTLL